MNSNRPNRATPNVPTIIANLGRSIDEARNRRLKPSEPFENAPDPRTELRIGSPEPSPAAPTPTPPPAPRSNQPPSPPPLRSPGEMFDSSGNRLKAKPKRAS